MKDKKEEEMKGYYVGERTTVTIENVAKTTLMTKEEYEMFSQEQIDKGNLPTVIFEPQEYTMNVGKLSMKIKKFCHAFEDGKMFTYYKSVEGQ
ncbi:MAG: hypothetical protein HY062_01290 [Bacteroidetes bacterium]|nr:hypothetical protein [Bacteroidota bacterium]